MTLSWISNRSLTLSHKVRLVGDDEAAALRRKLESIEWKPSNGFLRDQVAVRSRPIEARTGRAA